MANPQPDGQVIRCLIDLSNWQTALVDLIAEGPVVIPNGADLTFELMFFDSDAGAFSDASKLDFSTTNNIEVALQTTNDPHNSLIFWSSTLANADIVNGALAANWLAGTAQQAQIAVPSAINSILLNGSGAPLWLLIYAVSTDAVPKITVLSATQVKIVDTGLPPTFGTFYLPYNGLVYPVTIGVGLQGQLELQVGQNGVEAAGINAPFIAAPNGTYHLPTLVVSGNKKVITLV